jgi:hypothetical protein
LAKLLKRKNYTHLCNKEVKNIIFVLQNKTYKNLKKI